MLHPNVPDVSSRRYGRRGPFGAGRVLLALTGVLVAVMCTVYTALKGRVSQTKKYSFIGPVGHNIWWGKPFKRLTRT